jgi:hypothetical protein
MSTNGIQTNNGLNNNFQNNNNMYVLNNNSNIESFTPTGNITVTPVGAYNGGIHNRDASAEKNMKLSCNINEL